MKRSILVIVSLITSVGIVAQIQHKIINPFRIDIDPMERLMLVNFEKDPDTLYVGFEPQVFEDEINGTGHLVIGWRVDGKVDVYHQPGLKLNPEKYDIAGKGLANMLEREMPGAYFEIKEQGVRAYYEFSDIYYRRVRISISESNPRKRKPFGLLAPMGDAAEKPSALPLVILHDFYFVRSKHSEISIVIGNRLHHHDMLPIRMDGIKMTFVRYSPDLYVANVNPAFEGELEHIHVASGCNAMNEESHIEVCMETGLPAITRLQQRHREHVLDMSFEPAFPEIASMKSNSEASGVFEIAGHPSTGRIGGTYTVKKSDFETRITMIPSKGWIPKPDRFSLRFLYRAAKVFRNWPRTYIWEATIIEDDDSYYMRSGWKRTGRKQAETIHVEAEIQAKDSYPGVRFLYDLAGIDSRK